MTRWIAAGFLYLLAGVTIANLVDDLLRQTCYPDHGDVAERMIASIPPWRRAAFVMGWPLIATAMLVATRVRPPEHTEGTRR